MGVGAAGANFTGQQIIPFTQDAFYTIRLVVYATGQAYAFMLNSVTKGHTGGGYLSTRCQRTAPNTPILEQTTGASRRPFSLLTPHIAIQSDTCRHDP